MLSGFWAPILEYLGLRRCLGPPWCTLVPWGARVPLGPRPISPLDSPKELPWHVGTIVTIPTCRGYLYMSRTTLTWTGTHLGFFSKLKPEGISKNDSTIIWRTSKYIWFYKIWRLYRVLHIYWTIFNVSPFLSQLTQEKVMHFFRKPWILAVECNYETESKYIMCGSRRVLANLLGFCFLHWILITCYFYASWSGKELYTSKESYE